MSTLALWRCAAKVIAPFNERVSKNQVERERSGSGRSPERKRSGARAKSAAENPLHHKTTQSKKLKIDLKVTTKLSESIHIFCCWFDNKSDYQAKEHITSVMPRYGLGMLSVGTA